jgi:F-type H+-transporting ATPase subunit b
MPQFQPEFFSPQLVWLAITFILLYLLMSRVALPRIGQVLEEREHRINDNLRKAEKLKQEAEAAVAAYEKRMADARAKAQTSIREIREQLAVEAAERHQQLNERLAGEIASGEARIAEARAKAVESVRDMAVEVAAAAAARLIGGPVSEAAVARAVDQAIKEGA